MEKEELKQRLAFLQRELTLKQQKLEKHEKRKRAKEHVRQKIREQSALDDDCGWSKDPLSPAFDEIERPVGYQSSLKLNDTDKTRKYCVSFDLSTQETSASSCSSIMTRFIIDPGTPCDRKNGKTESESYKTATDVVNTEEKLVWRVDLSQDDGSPRSQGFEIAPNIESCTDSTERNAPNLATEVQNCSPPMIDMICDSSPHSSAAICSTVEQRDVQRRDVQQRDVQQRDLKELHELRCALDVVRMELSEHSDPSEFSLPRQFQDLIASKTPPEIQTTFSGVFNEPISSITESVETDSCSSTRIRKPRGRPRKLHRDIERGRVDQSMSTPVTLDSPLRGVSEDIGSPDCKSLKPKFESCTEQLIVSRSSHWTLSAVEIIPSVFGMVLNIDCKSITLSGQRIAAALIASAAGYMIYVLEGSVKRVLHECSQVQNEVISWASLVPDTVDCISLLIAVQCRSEMECRIVSMSPQGEVHQSIVLSRTTFEQCPLPVVCHVDCLRLVIQLSLEEILCYAVASDYSAVEETVKFEPSKTRPHSLVRVDESECVCGFGEGELTIWHLKTGLVLRRVTIEVHVSSFSRIFSEDGLLFVPCLVQSARCPVLVINPMTSIAVIAGRFQLPNCNQGEASKQTSKSWWQRRTHLELALIVVVLVTALSALIITALFAAKSASATSDSDYCMTKQCVKSAARILESMDSAVDPCEDFFEFACGNWNRQHQIPEERTKYDMFTKLNDGLQEALKVLFEAPIDANDIPIVANAKNLYISCLNTTAIAENENATLSRFLADIGGWPAIDHNWKSSNFDLTKSLARTRQVLSFTPLFILYVAADERNSTTSRIVIDQQSQNPMSHRDYYLKGRNDRLLVIYEKFVRDFLRELGASDVTLESDVTDMIEFEIRLANITIPMDQRRINRESQYNLYTASEMSNNLTNKIDWVNLLTVIFEEVGIVVNGNEQVIVRAPDYISLLGKVVEQTSNRTLQNYIAWWTLVIQYEALSLKLQHLRKDFSKALTGTDQEMPRWRTCVNYLNQNLGVVVGRIYVDKYFDEEAKGNALQMVRYVRQSFREILRELTWLEESTKLVAQEKADAMREKIGYPDFITNDTALSNEYPGIHCRPETFLENLMNISRIEVRKGLKQLRQPIDRDRWASTPVTPNAFYHPSKNIIMFPAGILQPPFYHKNNPMYLNFGGIATIIGHEISHGFDDHGRLYDKNGNVNLWWSEVDISKFKEKAQCFVEQYGNYTAVQVKRKINGIQTLGENIADNGGMKQSYRAYMNWVKENGAEKLLPGVQLSQEQLFYLNFAQSWCGSSRPELQLRWLLGFPHSPREIRVIGTLSNSAEFASAYKCPLGSPMNPARKCSVW